MKLIASLICILFILPAYASDAFEQLEKVLVSASLSDSLNSWEADLKVSEWRGNLENCYDRNIDNNARQALIKLLESNGQITSDMSSRDINQQLNFYCSHALSLAAELGIKLQLVPLDPGNVQVNIRQSFIESCYAFRAKGFTSSFRETLELMIIGGRQGLGLNKQEPVTAQEVAMVYVGMCGALFSKDPEIPVHAIFTTE